MTLALTAPSPPPPYPSRHSGKGIGRRHSEYYAEDGNLSILVSGTLFRVWTGLFRAPHSLAFGKQYPGLDATDDASPLRFDASVTDKDFEKFLWVLNPRVIGEFRTQTVDDWVTVLRLSSLWEFVAIRNLAIERLGSLKIDPVRKIVIHLQYKIGPEWAFDAFDALCRRREPLNMDEGRDVAVEVVTKVATAREALSKTWSKPESVVQRVWFTGTA
ncbi:hypothetical protein BD626DRAFT_392453 [Schizophyllum amplum]|uniref:BTB domain-containing protein n=1 Tax=Schizophyllum amplum TaxID=97359 RepID=A0A550CW52_9AGAR|nr:hypothetical protein BD626DRAFT_392453 [Auriculariopsis ampla]